MDSPFNYELIGNDRFGSVSGHDPTLTIKSGDTIIFNVDVPGSPFYIKTVATTGTGNQVVTGLSVNGITSGTITWNTIGITAGTYYYQSSLHVGMVGVIVINP